MSRNVIKFIRISNCEFETLINKVMKNYIGVRYNYYNYIHKVMTKISFIIGIIYTDL